MGDSAAYFACEAGDLERVRLLWKEAGAEAFRAVYSQLSALGMACYEGHEELARFLVEVLPADFLLYQGPKGRYPIYQALDRCSPTLQLSMAAQMPDEALTRGDEGGVSVLGHACRYSSFELLQHLATRLPQAAFGEEPLLFYAIQAPMKSLGCVGVLLDCLAEEQMMRLDDCGKNALHSAAHAERYDVLLLLTERMPTAALRMQSTSYQQTPLHVVLSHPGGAEKMAVVAAMVRRMEEKDLLLAGHDGRTAAHLAALHGRGAELELVLNELEGDEVFSMRCSAGGTVLSYACGSLSVHPPPLQLVTRTPLDVNTCHSLLAACIMNYQHELLRALVEDTPSVLSRLEEPILLVIALHIRGSMPTFAFLVEKTPLHCLTAPRAGGNNVLHYLAHQIPFTDEETEAENMEKLSLVVSRVAPPDRHIRNAHGATPGDIIRCRAPEGHPFRQVFAPSTKGAM